MWEYNNKINLKGNMVWACELDSSGSGWSPMADFCEHGNEPSGSV